MLLFGPLSDIAGWRERTINPALATLSALRDQLAVTLRSAKGARPAVGKAIVRGVST